jgi:rhodanese-related sulfurtransferase
MAVQDLKACLDKNEALLVLDVRDEPEFRAGSIPGARHISMDSLSERVRAGALDDFREAAIAVVCGSGIRSAQATVRLQKVLGFEGALHVRGGVEAWREAGFPLHRSPEADGGSASDADGGDGE